MCPANNKEEIVLFITLEAMLQLDILNMWKLTVWTFFFNQIKIKPISENLS